MICDKQTLFQLLNNKALLITPNNRLSGALLKDYFFHQQEHTLEKPLCLPYGTALTQAYQKLIHLEPRYPHPLLADINSCHFILKALLEQESAISCNEGLLRSILQAWQHVELWQLNPEDPHFQATSQMRLFQKWWQQLNQQLRDQNLIHETQLVPYLCKSKQQLFPAQIIWACFDEYTPQQKSLQAFLETQGITQYHYDLKVNPVNAHCLHASDTKDELEQLTLWLKTKLAEGKRRIGVVIPDLQNQYASLYRHFNQHFDEASFTLSLGMPLNQFPLAAHALAWLKLPMRNFSPHQTTLLLQSPYLSHAKEEFFARSQYLQDSRLLQGQQISKHRFIEDLKGHAPKLAEALAQLNPYPKHASIHQWIACFLERLRLLGFPGDYGFNSENYQIFNRLLTVFDELRSIHLVAPSLNQSEAIDVLQHRMQQTIFQIKKDDTPIQISGLLEASGCEFDCLWIMGLTDQTLPQKSKLSPFIPKNLQKELFMPHSTPERELQFAIKTLQRLYYGSPECILSYARFDGDTPNLPSSLIYNIPSYIKLTDTLREDSLSLEEAMESYLIPQNIDEVLSGGTYALANQAKCPFKAFAEHRLKAKPTIEQTEGIDPKERGQVIHKIMELLWNNIKEQSHLVAMPLAELEFMIEDAILKSLNILNTSHPALTHSIEMLRLKKIIHACLEWEKQRPPFKILALEQTYTISLANLEFKVRVDRLDQVASHKWVIDYKSSLPPAKPWNEDRPKEPQLLLYALLDEEINALMHLQLKAGNLQLSGISEEPIELSGLSTIKKGETWSECLTRWREQLTLLSEEFQQGFCPPKPASSAICQQCDFNNLCRIKFAL